MYTKKLMMSIYFRKLYDRGPYNSYRPVVTVQA